MKTLSRIFGAVVGMSLLAGPALAQQKPTATYGETDQGKTPSEIAAEKETERAYRRSLGNIPEAQKSSDPWGTMRGDGAAPKAAAKTTPAKPKPKSAETAK